MRPDRPGLRTERLDYRHERLGLKPDRPDLRPERPDVRPERPDLRSQRPDLRPEGSDGGKRTNGRFCIFLYNTIQYTIMESIGPIQYNPNTIQFFQKLYTILNNIKNK